MSRLARAATSYVPHARQVAFHQRSEQFVLFLGGIRSGKTVAGTNEFFWRVAHKPDTYVVIAPTYRMIKDVEVVEWLKWVPNQAIRTMIHGSEPECTLVNDSRILFRSGERPDRLRGLTLGGGRIGEAALLRTSDVWDIFQGRVLSTGGWGLLDTTPKGRGWVYDEFLSAKRKIARAKAVITCRTIENPTIPRAMIDQLRESYSDKMAQQELDAICIEGWDGLVYPEYRGDVHVRDKVEFDGSREVFLGIDWGVQNPTVVLVVQTDASDRIRVIGERRFTGEPASATAKATKAWLRECGWWKEGSPLPKCYSDPSGATERLEWQQAGFRRMLNGEREVKAGVESVHWAMKTRKAAEGQPIDTGLLIGSSCMELADELTGYQYTGKGEEILKERDHGPDALRYVVSGLMWTIKKRVRKQVEA